MCYVLLTRDAIHRCLWNANIMIPKTVSIAVIKNPVSDKKR